MSPTQARRKGASRTCLDLGRCLTLAGSAGLSSLKCPRGSQPCSRELSSASRAPRHLLPELVSGVPGAPPSPATWSPEGGTALCAISFLPNFPADPSPTRNPWPPGRLGTEAPGARRYTAHAETSGWGPQHTHTAACVCRQ